MAKTEIDVNQLPAGLTKKEFVNLRQRKSLLTCLSSRARGAGSHGQELSELSQECWDL